MWDFSWTLGLELAAAVAVLNTLWCELRMVRDEPADKTVPLPTP